MPQIVEEKNIQKTEVKQIPEYLIYEIIDGIPYYRKGYQEVLNKQKTLEDIMGASSLQVVIINYLIRLFAKYLDEDAYYIATNEAGLHLAHKSNLSNNIAIYDTTVLTPDKISDKYADVPPKIVVEVDVKIEQAEEGYVQIKTKKMLDFGVETVIWIFTKPQTVMLATKNENWQIIDWNKTIDLGENIKANIGEYLKKKGIQL